MATLRIFLLGFSISLMAQVTNSVFYDSLLSSQKESLTRVHQKGYLFARLIYDSAGKVNDLFKGEKVTICVQNTTFYGQKIAKKIPSGDKICFFKFIKYQRLIEKILVTYENNGYPFVTIKPVLDSFRNDCVYLQLHVFSGRLVTIDSIVQRPLPVLPKTFLQTWLQIRPGDKYDEKKIRNAFQILRNNPWIETTSDPLLKFKNDGVSLHLFIKRRKSNSFQGLIGFSQTAQKRWQLTGQGNLYVCNLLNLGEEISLQWTGYGQSQLLNLRAKVPYLAGTSLGGSLSFELQKVDTFFLKAQQSYGLVYSFYPHQISAYYQFRQNVPFVSGEIAQNENYMHTRHNMGGVRAEFRRIDDILLPRRGWEADVDACGGMRLTLPAADDTTNVQTRSYLFNFAGNLKTYLPVTSWMGLYGSSGLAQIFHPALTANEGMLRGGFSNLRGFDENSLIMKHYLLFTLELRLFFERYAYFVLFSDYCTGEQWYQKAWEERNYVSLGGGLVFSVRAGIFRIYYALGKANSDNFMFSSGKIHAGLSVRF